MRDAATEEVFFDDEVAFGERRGAGAGRSTATASQLGIDKSGQRLVPTFSTRDRDDISALLDAVQQVLEALRTAGAKPFVGYGTLLGAVREGAVLGHDNDADIAYVSDTSAPVDVVRESFRLQREVNAQGFETVRYSGAAFKVLVEEADGFRRGLDVFGGFLDHGRLYLMGEVGVSFEREWIYPLGTAQLEGVDVPVPARPEKLLEAMYGPGWRYPDPAFKFETPQRTRSALNAWFRGLRPNFSDWQRRFARPQVRPARSAGPPSAPGISGRSPRRPVRQCSTSVRAGAPTASGWLGPGVPVVAYDFVNHQLQRVAEACQAERPPLEVRTLNLTECAQLVVARALDSRGCPARGSCSPSTCWTRPPAGTGGVRAVLLDGLPRRRYRVRAVPHGRRPRARVEWSTQVDTDRGRRRCCATPVPTRLEFSTLERAGRPDAMRLVAEWPT